MPTTVTPLAHDACIASSAVTPSSAEPYPTLVGTATTGAPVRPPITLANAPSMPAITITASAEVITSSLARSRCRPATPTSIDEFGIDAIGPQRGDHLIGDGSIARAGRDDHDATVEPLAWLAPEQAAAQLDHAGSGVTVTVAAMSRQAARCSAVERVSRTAPVPCCNSSVTMRAQSSGCLPGP